MEPNHGKTHEYSQILQRRALDRLLAIVLRWVPSPSCLRGHLAQKRMKILLRTTCTLAAVAFVSVCSLFCSVSMAADAGDWRPLFDGQTLEGWTQRGGAAKYRVENGEIVGTSVPNTANSFLCTNRNYGNFILELEFKVDPKLNSGVQIRSQCFDKPVEFEQEGKTKTIPAGRVHGYQVEIDPGDRAWSGGIYDEGRRAWLNNLKENEKARQAFRRGEWNKFRIECRGDSIKTWINDVPAADLKDNMTSEGFIALQVHGVGDATDAREVHWRQIRLKELAAN